MDNSIIKHLNIGFEQDLYEAAIYNLEDNNNKLRFNNFAYAIRELMYQVLKRLAPDDYVTKCIWYKAENDKHKITHRQRAIYAVQGGLSDDFIKNTLKINSDVTHNLLVKEINKLSKYTHIDPSTFNLDQNTTEAMATETTTAICSLFDTIEVCKQKIIESLWEQIDTCVIFNAIKETIESLDEIATHHSIEEVYTDKVVITAIDHENIYFTANGNVSCEFQWGSNADIRNDMGAILPLSHPFECKLLSPVDAPNTVEVDEYGILVDTSSWWDGVHEDYCRDAQVMDII